jgi:hypothetical protein
VEEWKQSGIGETPRKALSPIPKVRASVFLTLLTVNWQLRQSLVRESALSTEADLARPYQVKCSLTRDLNRQLRIVLSVLFEVKVMLPPEETRTIVAVPASKLLSQLTGVEHCYRARLQPWATSWQDKETLHILTFNSLNPNDKMMYLKRAKDAANCQ